LWFLAPSTQWWRQLSTAIVFGLCFATVLTLVATPAALMARTNLRALWDMKRARGNAPEGPEPVGLPHAAERV